MNRTHRPGPLCRMVLGIICALFPAWVVAQEITIDHFAGLGARAMGMGGAYTAVAEDFTALYWNPAGLAQIRRIELYSALSHQRDEARTTFFGTPRTTELSKTRLSALGIVLPVPTYRGSLVFSFGFNRVKSFDSTFGIEGFSTTAQVHRRGRATDEGGLGIYSLGGAVDISPSVSLGLAFNVWDGEDAFTQTLVNTDTVNVREERTLWFEDEYDGVNFKLAALVRTPVGLRFGFTLDTPITHKVEEEWRDDVDGDVERGILDYKVSLPYQFGLGASWTIPHLLTIAADAVYNDWKQTRYKGEPPVEGVTNEDFETKYKDVWRLHVGGEFLLPVVPIHIRAGFYSDPIPFFGPRVPGDPRIRITDDRKYITLGAGTLIDQVLALDVAWVRGTSDQTEGRTTEKHEDSRVFLSAAYRF